MWRLILAALLLTSASLAQAQDSSSWIGQRVITQCGAVLKIGTQVVDDEKRSDNLAASGSDRVVFRVYRVEHASGDWLWLKAENGGAEGWVQSPYVIPYIRAIDYFTSQIRATPGDHVWYQRRGNVWREKGEYDIAVGDFNEAIRLMPSSADAWLNRGAAWYAKKDYDKAIGDYGEAIRLDPNFALAYCNRGGGWYAKKDYDRAIADFNEAIRLDPNFALAYCSRGATWGLKKDQDKALADYNEAIRLDPKFGDAFFRRGNAWRARNDLNRAIADYDEAIRLDPMNRLPYIGRACAWESKKEYEKERADRAEAIRLGPRYAIGSSDRARPTATRADGTYRNGQAAVADVSQASAADDSKEADYLDMLADAYAACGEFDKAIEWQQEANQLHTEAGDKKRGEERLKLFRDKSSAPKR